MNLQTFRELVARWWMNVKLNRGRCEECGRILPDVHPIENYRACGVRFRFVGS